jgi:hypothetical protein
MKQAAPTSLKWVYSIVVLSAVVPVGVASSSWVAMARGGGGALAGLPYLGPLLLLLLGLYRTYLVARVPGTLASYPAAGFAGVLRRFGVFALYFGAAVGLLNLSAGPLMKLLMTPRTESGAEFFVVGVYLSFLGGVGVLGLVLFELSRIVGFEKHEEQHGVR